MNPLEKVPPVPVQPPGEHSACFSFSAADRWLGTAEKPGCTASVWWGLNVPARPPGDAAIEGSRLHALAEQYLRGEVSLEDLEESDADMLRGLENSPIPDDALIEERVGLPDIDADLYGTADVIWTDDDGVLHVWDHKFGYIEAGWLQLKLYALAALDGKPADVVLHIYQPKAGGLKTLEVSAYELAKVLERVRLVVGLVRSGNAKYYPGDHCKYCPAITQCPAVDDLVDTTGKEPAGLSNAELADTLDHLPVLKAFIAAVEDEALRRANDGVTVPRYKLVAKQARRSWVDETAVWRWGLAHGVNLTKGVLLSPAQADKVLKSAGVDSDEDYDKLSTRTSSGTVLVPESDKREEVINVNAARRAMKSASFDEWRKNAEITL